MIPLRDDSPTTRKPVVTWALIGLCVVVFLLQAGVSGEVRDGITYDFALVPARVTTDGPVVVEMPAYDRFGRVVLQRQQVPPAAVPEWLTLLTCIFLHGGVLHLVFNVWVLWIFGDNVEDRLGRVGYLVFYLGCGVLASLSHLLSAPDSPVPTVGASGAIAGVMGAYLLLYPRARVLALIPLGFLLQLVTVPAAVFLGLWLALQLLQAAMSAGQEQMGGVAWWAHIGGFGIGLLVVWVLRQLGWLRPPPSVIALSGRRMRWRPGGGRRGRDFY